VFDIFGDIDVVCCAGAREYSNSIPRKVEHRCVSGLVPGRYPTPERDDILGPDRQMYRSRVYAVVWEGK
jgi:hypothetical protein